MDKDKDDLHIKLSYAVDHSKWRKVGELELQKQ